MKSWFEKLIADLWNAQANERPAPSVRSVLDVGREIADGEPSHRRVGIDQKRRAESLCLIGKTGTGKSSLIRYFASQDVAANRGFAFPDLHGDSTDFLVRTIAEQERFLKRDLSERLIVIDPSDPEYSVGLNPLESASGNDRFLQVSEFSEILKQRWHLDSLGARTDELLRNALFVLAENDLTLIELALLLSQPAFRSQCLRRVTNPEVRQYFELRYDAQSDAMRAVMNEPVLNKISAFTSDPRFRDVVGQAHSTFSILEALDHGAWIILKLDKGRLGEQALTLGSLFLAKVKHALFARRRRELFTIYADEVQNLVALGGGLETILSEARKFGVGMVTGNQFLEQYPAEMRAAVLATGSQLFFQLSGGDAQQIAGILDGGRPLAERLKNLPRRHVVVKTVHERWREAVVPTVREPKIDPSDLYLRSRTRWARSRQDIEASIHARQAGARQASREVLHDWE